jgi:hypothetical protein
MVFLCDASKIKKFSLRMRQLKRKSTALSANSFHATGLSSVEKDFYIRPSGRTKRVSNIALP